MQNDVSRYCTKDLLQLATDKNDPDLAYQAQWTLFKRWEDGIDVSFLIDFIDTEDVNDRLRGAYFLFEVSPRSDSVKDAVLKLADDVLAECRRAFVGYLINSGWYDETAAQGLVRCIQDFDLRVRLNVIDWAIATTDQRFEDFSRLVLADARDFSSNTWEGRLKKRGIRALDIAGQVRCGVSVEKIKQAIPEEDGFTFDQLGVFESYYKRQRERQKPLDQQSAGEFDKFPDAGGSD